jgi:hypothetical protein
LCTTCRWSHSYYWLQHYSSTSNTRVHLFFHNSLKKWNRSFLKKFVVCQWAIFLEFYFCEYVVSIAEYPRNLETSKMKIKKRPKISYSCKYYILALFFKFPPKCKSFNIYHNCLFLNYLPSKKNNIIYCKNLFRCIYWLQLYF